MADRVTVRTRKFQTNPLLGRKQMVVDVIHGRLPNVSKADLQHRLASMYKVQDPSNIVLFGFRTIFGGGRSSGFALIYTNKEARFKYEPKYRLLRFGVGQRSETARKQKKERKNRAKKFRGLERAKILTKK
eukprot:EC689570.1.p1 GENE.EC689570.1~~EC689570.1.p1  ORF type:complete len:131 (+),score=54.44 EC689570.1:65-457(+)